jgi:transcription elongation GreA/GreB family factor
MTIKQSERKEFAATITDDDKHMRSSVRHNRAQERRERQTEISEALAQWEQDVYGIDATGGTVGEYA